MNVENREIKLEKEDVIVTSEAKGNFAVSSDEYLTIALDLELTDSLLEEGFAREFVNRVQNLRKEAGFEVTDHIIIQVQGLPAEKVNALRNRDEYIRNETLADAIEFDTMNAPFKKEVKIDDLKFTIGLVKSTQGSIN